MAKPLEERVVVLKDLDNDKTYHGEVRVCTENLLVVSFRKDLTAEIEEVPFDV